MRPAAQANGLVHIYTPDADELITADQARARRKPHTTTRRVPHVHAPSMQASSRQCWVSAFHCPQRSLCFQLALTTPQARKVSTLPHTLLSYATHLTRLHIEAGRTLVALRPYSCFSLNSRAAAPLYGPPSVNLLELLGSYDLPPPLSHSAVGTWLTPMPPAERAPGEAEACDLRLPELTHLHELAIKHSTARRGAGRPLSSRPLGRRYSRAAEEATLHESRAHYRDLHAEAGLSMERGKAPGSWPKTLTRTWDYAYVQGWHRVDGVVKAYLDRTRDLRNGQA